MSTLGTRVKRGQNPELTALSQIETVVFPPQEQMKRFRQVFVETRSASSHFQAFDVRYVQILGKPSPTKIPFVFCWKQTSITGKFYFGWRRKLVPVLSCHCFIKTSSFLLRLFCIDKVRHDFSLSKPNFGN